jgi:Family of unknown function (DUF5996)
VTAGFCHNLRRIMVDEPWPSLAYDAWKDTYRTLHMWTQMVGKIALASAPPVNHSWAVAMHVSARGLSTRLLRHDRRSFTIEFDFITHRLVVATSDGEEAALPLEPRSVAEFYKDFRAMLASMGLAVKIWPMPVEIPAPVRFDEDTEHHSYDPLYANRFWRILVQIERLFTASRCQFVGKTSPVHFFWGGFDLAVTRFSGRPAPPREGPSFMRDAYSHEVISHGFWPGSPPLLEPAFYAYAVPEPTGLKTARVRPDAAFYHTDLGQFILPYEAVRTAGSPDNMLLAFVDSTYSQAATLAKWDRESLERTPAQH